MEERVRFGLKVKLTFFFILCLFFLLLLEVGIRLITVEKKAGYEYIMGKPHRYMLPFHPVYVESDTSSFKKYNVYDDSLGWSIGTLGKNEPLYYSDKYGLRCSEEDQGLIDSRQKNYNLVFIGDSFTHGNAVVFEKTWVELIQQKTGKSILNLGVGGYGIDQAVLRFVNSPWKADTLVLGLIAGDLERSLSTIYNFYNGGNKSKPKFKFSDGVELLNVPSVVNQELYQNFINYEDSEILNEIPGFGNKVLQSNVLTSSYLYRAIISTAHQIKNRRPPVYRTKDERFDYCMNILQYMENLSNQNNFEFIVLLLDNNNTLNDRKIVQDPWKLLRDELDSRKIDYWNVTNEMQSAYNENPSNIIHPEEGVHYSEMGNELVSELLIKKYLK